MNMWKKIAIGLSGWFFYSSQLHRETQPGRNSALKQHIRSDFINLLSRQVFYGFLSMQSAVIVVNVPL